MAARKTAPKKAARKKKPVAKARSARAKPESASDVAKRNERMNGLTVDLICETANGVHKEITKHRKPDLAFPVRSPRPYRSRTSPRQISPSKVTASKPLEFDSKMLE